MANLKKTNALKSLSRVSIRKLLMYRSGTPSLVGRLRVRDIKAAEKRKFIKMSREALTHELYVSI